MTQDAVRALQDKELAQVVAWAQEEQRARAEQHKHDTIAKIREMAVSVGISVSLNSRRGRPPKAKSKAVMGKKTK